MKGNHVFGFGEAIRRLKEGKQVARKSRNGPHQVLTLQVPNANSEMTLPYIYIDTVQGNQVPWVASQTDMLAMDWFEVQ